jgi:hypothetical protein
MYYALKFFFYIKPRQPIGVQSWDWLRHVLKRFNRQGQGAYTLQYLKHCTDRWLMKNKMLNRILVSMRPLSLQIERRLGHNPHKDVPDFLLARQIKTEAPFFDGNRFLAIL